jgi:glycosyltransferase
MKASIITACLNSVATIEDTIKSILMQDYKDIEHIVIDGGSTDATLQVIEKYRNKIAVFVSEPDNGIYNAINKGIKLSSGELIATLNSNDIYADPGIVARMVEFISSQNLDAAYGDLVYIDSLDTNKVVRYWQPGKYRRGAFSHGWVPPHPTFFCRKKFFEKFGYFNDKFQIAADFELMLRFMEKHKIKVGYLPKCIVKMRTGGKANVLKGRIRGNIEIINSLRLNGLCLSPWFFIRKPIDKMCQLIKKSQVTEQ